MITLEHDLVSQATCDCGATAMRISSPFASVGLTTYSHAFLCTHCHRVQFTPADPRRSVIIVTSRRASTPCTNCYGQIAELPNPYYGVKRAMSPSIRFCPQCDQA